MTRAGIAVAGNLLTDYVKRVNTYPRPGELANILSLSRAVGGCVPNTLLDLARIDPQMPLFAYGCVGGDADGEYVLASLSAAGINTAGVAVRSDAPTSFSDAMAAQDTGERTFFHHRGANALFAPEQIDVRALTCRMLHIGYLLLLDRFDAPDAEYGTAMARFLHAVQEQEIATCIDAVSDSTGAFARVVVPALRYCDYAVMNELEGCAAFGLSARDGQGRLIRSNIERALTLFMEAGVRRRAVFHCPEAGFCMDAESGLTVVPSFRLPEGYVKGSVGAGDAFCAGCLYGAYHGFSPEETLSFAAAAAAANLSAVDAVSGMKSREQLQKMMKEWERRAYETIGI